MGLKIAALLLMAEGQRPGWISEVLGISRESLNRWVHAVNERGLKALEWQPRPGRPCKLTGKIQEKLEQDLEKSPMEVGLHRARWDGPTVVVYLKRKYDIPLKVRQAQYWMHRLGFRLKRAGYSYIQAKKGAGTRFLNHIKKTPNAGTA
jgi:transposase